jgi:hypothetical protein
MTEPAATGAAPGPPACRRWIFSLFAGVFLLTASGRLDDNADVILMYGVGQGLALSGRPAIPQEYVSRLPEAPNGYDHLKGRDGALYFPKGLAYSAAMVPFILAGRAIGSLAGRPVSQPEMTELTMLSASAVTPLFAALNCVLVFEILVALGFAQRLAGVVTLAAGVGTILWSGSLDGTVESVTGALITAVYLGLVRLHRSPQPRWSAWTGCALALLVLAQPGMVVLVVPLSVLYAARLAVRSRATYRLATAALAFGLPLAFGLALAAWSNAARYGSSWLTGYEWAARGPRGPLYVGVYGLLFSAGKSVFLYSPPLVLAAFAAPRFIRRVGWVATFPFVLLATFVLAYGGVPYWGGDGAWGPRYLIPLTGSLCTSLAGLPSDGPVEWRLTRAALAFFVALGVGVNLIGATTSTGAYFSLLLRSRVILDNPWSPRWSPILFDPELSPIVGRAHVLASALHRSLHGTSLSWNLPMRSGGRAPVALAGFDEWQPWLLRLHLGDGPGPGLLGWWRGAVPYVLSVAALLAGLSMVSAARLWQLSRGGSGPR